MRGEMTNVAGAGSDSAAAGRSGSPAAATEQPGTRVDRNVKRAGIEKLRIGLRHHRQRESKFARFIMCREKGAIRSPEQGGYGGTIGNRRGADEE